jgi:methionyl-tRNA formyltransferase
VQQAIWHGDDVTGADVRSPTRAWTPAVYGIVTETIDPQDTSGTLLARLARTGAGLLVATLDALEDGAVHAIAQVGEPSFAPKITVEDARVRWDLPAIGVDRQIRACTPAPGAWTMIDEERVRVLPVGLGAEPPDLQPGHVRVTRREVWVGTATQAVLLGDVQPAGRKTMTAADWARGARLTDAGSRDEPAHRPSRSAALELLRAVRRETPTPTWCCRRSSTATA